MLKRGRIPPAFIDTGAFLARYLSGDSCHLKSAAIGIFRKYANQNVSFTDCISFVLMRRQGIKRAFTFGRHFAHAGFRAIDVETES